MKHLPRDGKTGWTADATLQPTGPGPRVIHHNHHNAVFRNKQGTHNTAAVNILDVNKYCNLNVSLFRDSWYEFRQAGQLV